MSASSTPDEADMATTAARAGITATAAIAVVRSTDTTAVGATVAMAAAKGITTRATVTDLRVSRCTRKARLFATGPFRFPCGSARPTFGTGNAVRDLLA